MKKEDIKLNDEKRHDRQVAAIRDVLSGKATEETVRVLKEWAKAEPNNTSPFANLGEALLQLGRSGEAKEAVEKALALDPEDRSALRVQRDILAKAGTGGASGGCLVPTYIFIVILMILGVTIYCL